MALLWEKRAAGVHYSVRNAGNTVRLYTNGVLHTQYNPTSTPMPHSFTVDLGASRAVGGFKYLPRPGAYNGTVLGWRFYRSADGVSWTLAGQGSFARTAAEKVVTIAP